MHYFGEELVLFRTASGQVNVLDAYCQHLGANMGVGGTVEDENIVCPWHGWQWRGDGTNALIPYSKIGCKNNVRIRTYPTAWSGTASSWSGTNATGGRRTGSRRCCPNWKPASTTRCTRTAGCSTGSRCTRR